MKDNICKKKKKSKLGNKTYRFLLLLLAPTIIAFCILSVSNNYSIRYVFCKWDYSNINVSGIPFVFQDLWNNYGSTFLKNISFSGRHSKNSTTWAILGAVVQIPVAMHLIALALSRKNKGN